MQDKIQIQMLPFVFRNVVHLKVFRNKGNKYDISKKCKADEIWVLLDTTYFPIFCLLFLQTTTIKIEVNCNFSCFSSWVENYKGRIMFRVVEKRILARM
jgi:hypothetical protein